MQALHAHAGKKTIASGKIGKLAAATLAAVLLCACGTAPLSFLDGRLRPSSKIQFNVYSVRVISVDGDFSLQNPRQIAPGLHTLVVNAAPGPGARNVGQKNFTFNVEPCTRYYLAAKRPSAMSADWDLMVAEKEIVSGCDPEKELVKSKNDKSAQLKTG